jgi:hypothetical protein
VLDHRQSGSAGAETQNRSCPAGAANGGNGATAAGLLGGTPPRLVPLFRSDPFSGVRPDMAHGEIAKLAAAVKRDGVERYFRNGVLHISGEIAKDRRTRQIAVPENVTKWIQHYRIAPESICPADWETCQLIRDRFKIPHDGLRHTAILAHVSAHGSFADAAAQIRELGSHDPNSLLQPDEQTGGGRFLFHYSQSRFCECRTVRTGFESPRDADF